MMAMCPQCGEPMLNLGWLDIEVDEVACPKCDREKFLALGWDPEEVEEFMEAEA